MICPKCGSRIEDNAIFCSNCGVKFAVNPQNTNNAQSTGLNAGTYPQNQINAQPGQNPYHQTQSGQQGQNFYAQPAYTPHVEKQKSKNSGKIAVIVCSVILCLGFLGTVVNILIDRFYNAPAQNDYQFEQGDSENIQFELGSFDGTTYINEWADLKCVLPENWAEAPQSEYDTYADEFTTCDFYAVCDDYSLISIVFFDISSVWDINLYSDEEIMDYYIEGLTSDVEVQNIPEKYYEMLGNQSYLAVDIIGEQNGIEVCVSSFLRRVDDHVIVVNSTGSDIEKNHKNLEMIESVR